MMVRAEKSSRSPCALVVFLCALVALFSFVAAESVRVDYGYNVWGRNNLGQDMNILKIDEGVIKLGSTSTNINDGVAILAHGDPAIFVNGYNRNVGIGTKTPFTDLQVAGRLSLAYGDLGAAGVDGWGAQLSGGSVFLDSHGSKTYFRVGAGSGENAAARTAMVFDNANGNVGIGTDQPAGARLRVFGGKVRVDDGFQSDGGNLLTTLRQDDWTFATGGTAHRMVITKDGNGGIGTSTPASKLDVNGDLKVNGKITSEGEICIGSGC